MTDCTTGQFSVCEISGVLYGSPLVGHWQCCVSIFCSSCSTLTFFSSFFVIRRSPKRDHFKSGLKAEQKSTSSLSVLYFLFFSLQLDAQLANQFFSLLSSLTLFLLFLTPSLRCVCRVWFSVIDRRGGGGGRRGRGWAGVSWGRSCGCWYGRIGRLGVGTSGGLRRAGTDGGLRTDRRHLLAPLRLRLYALLQWNLQWEKAY